MVLLFKHCLNKIKKQRIKLRFYFILLFIYLKSQFNPMFFYLSKIKKNEKKPCDVYVFFNGRVTELMGMKIKFEIKNFNFKF